MSTPTENKNNNKYRVRKLLNLGYFDDHLSEVRQSLFSNRLFSKDLVSYINNNNLPNMLKSFTQRNKNYIESEKKRKKIKNSINLYKLNKHDEVEFHSEIYKILKSLNNFKNDLNNKFLTIKKENDDFLESFDAYKERNKKIHGNIDKKLLLDLASNYKSDKNFSFDLNSFNSDVLKDSPLSTIKLDQLKLYYILHRMRNKHKNDKHNQKSNQNFEQKEPIIWKEGEMNDLKEIKFLSKINLITKNKITKSNILNYSNEEIAKEKKEGWSKFKEGPDKTNNIHYKSFDELLNINERKIKIKEEREKKQLEIEKDKKEIDKLKLTINETFGLKNRKKTFNSRRFNNLKNISENISNNLSDIKEQTFSANNKNILDLKTKYKIRSFNSTINKDSLSQSSSFNNLKALNESKTKNFSVYSKESNSNNLFQHSTCYSNSINNKTSLNKQNFNSRKMNKNKSYKIELRNEDYSLKEISLNKKLDRRKTLINKLNIKYKSFLNDPNKNSIDNIYSICKKIHKTQKTRNKNESMDIINHYIKSKKKDSFINSNLCNLKETFSFFNKIKYQIKNEDVKFSFRNLKMMDKSKGKKKLKYIDLLDSNLINKENELLYKVLKRK